MTVLALKKRLGLKPSLGLGNFQGGGVLSLDALLQSILSPNGEDYAFFDFTDTSRLFQENIGPTPASTIGNVIGLGIDKNKQGGKSLNAVLAAQPNLVINGDFAASGNANGWSSSGTGGVISVADGALRLTSNQANYYYAYQDVPSTQGKLYAVTATYRLVSGTTGWFSIGTPASPNGLALKNAAASFITTTLYVVATGPAIRVSIEVQNVVGTAVEFKDVSMKEVPAHYAPQATASAKPTYQTTGAKFDGSDDNLLSDWLAQVGENCIIAQVDVPASLAGTQTISGASSANRWRLEVQSTGVLEAAVGSRVLSTSSVDLRGTSAIVAMSIDGTTIRAFANAQEVLTVAQSFDAPDTADALRLGANNAGGTATQFWGGSIKRLAFGKKAITLAQFQQIRQQWLAAA